MHELTEYKSNIQANTPVWNYFAPIDEYKQTSVSNHHLKLATVITL